MKILKLLATFLFFAGIVTLLLSLLLPVHQVASSTISINSKPAVIYETVRKLENFNRFAVWSREDSTAHFTNSGTDGTVGAKTNWEGHPMISGEGSITITELVPGRKVAHRIDFIKPKKGRAESIFDLAQTVDTATNVTWTFKMATPRPWNIFNMFYNLDKERGKEFEDGLNLLKRMVEKDSL